MMNPPNILLNRLRFSGWQTTKFFNLASSIQTLFSGLIRDLKLRALWSTVWMKKSWIISFSCSDGGCLKSESLAVSFRFNILLCPIWNSSFSASVSIFRGFKTAPFVFRGSLKIEKHTQSCLANKNWSLI